MSRLAGPPVSRHVGQVRKWARETAAKTGADYVTLGEKMVKGRPVGEKALKFHVRTKSSKPRGSLVPARFDFQQNIGVALPSLATDVVEIEASPCHFSIASGDRIRAFDGDLGVATITIRKGARSYVLTNAHVAANLLNLQTGVASWFDRQTGGWFEIGDVIHVSPMNSGRIQTEDLAVISSLAPVSDRGLASSPPGQINRMDILRSGLGEHWFIADALYKCTRLEPILSDVFVDVDGIRLTYRGVWQGQMVEGKSHAGISGSLLCRTYNGEIVACGQIFGGIPGNFVWAFPFKPIIDSIWPRLPA